MIDPERLIELSEEVSSKMGDYLTLKQVVARLERGRHTVHGRAMVVLREMNPKVAVDLLKASAFACEEYVAYLAEWDKAERAFVEVQAEVDSLRVKIEALQSYFAFKREELRRL